MREETMDEEESDAKATSTLLSPQQITEIDNTFTKMFEKAQKTGLVRDAKSYRSFDEIFDISMRLHKGQKVADEELYRPVIVGRSNWKPVEKRPLQTKPVETRPVGPKPVQSKPIETKSVEAQVEGQRKSVGPQVEARKSVEIAHEDRMDIVQDIPVQPATVPEQVKTRGVRADYARMEANVDGDFTFSDEELPPLPPKSRARSRKKKDDGDTPPPAKRRKSEGAPPVEPGRQRPFWGNRWTGSLYPEHTHKWRREQRQKRLNEELGEGNTQSEPIIPSDTNSPSAPHNRTNTVESVTQYYLELPPMKSVTLVCQRRSPTKPRGLLIPFYGRQRTKARKIDLTKLWDIHFRLARQRRDGAKKKSTPPVVPDETKLSEVKTITEEPRRSESVDKEIVDSNGVKASIGVESRINGVGIGRTGVSVSRARRGKPRPRRGTEVVGAVERNSSEV